MYTSLGLCGNCLLLIDNIEKNTTSDYIKGDSLYSIIDKYDKNILHKIIKQWIITQLKDIKNEHILVSNTNTTNVYYNEDNNIIQFIDYSDSKQFKLIDRVNTYNEDIIYKFDPLKPQIEDNKRLPTSVLNIFIHQVDQFNTSDNSRIHGVIAAKYSI